MHTYAGIGSRRTPADILDLMTRLAVRLHGRGYYLYSGGAPGADYAFYQGARSVGRNYTLFIPWHGFNRFSDLEPNVECGVTEDALALAASVHPAWRRLSPWAQKLHARNGYQVLGPDLRSPVRFVVCWTPDGAESEAETTIDTGGTGQAIRLAGRYGIPIFNLARAASRDRVFGEELA